MRRLAALVLTLATAVTVTACNERKPGGSSPTSTSNAEVLKPAPDIATLGQAMNTAISGAKTYAVTMKGTSKDGPQTLSSDGVIRMTGSTAEISMTLNSSEEGEGKVVMLRDAWYVQSKEIPLPDGRKWVKFSATGDDDDPIAKMMKTVVDQMQKHTNLSGTTQMFIESGSITSSKVENLTGTEVVRYDISVDIAKAAKAASNEYERKAYDELIKNGIKTFEHSIWINDRGLPVQMVTNQELPGPEGRTQRMHVTMTFSKWGEPVTITAPPAGEVSDLAEMIKSMKPGN